MNLAGLPQFVVSGHETGTAPGPVETSHNSGPGFDSTLERLMSPKQPSRAHADMSRPGQPPTKQAARHTALPRSRVGAPKDLATNSSQSEPSEAQQSKATNVDRQFSSFEEAEEKPENESVAAPPPPPPPLPAEMLSTCTLVQRDNDLRFPKSSPIEGEQSQDGNAEIGALPPAPNEGATVPLLQTSGRLLPWVIQGFEAGQNNVPGGATFSTELLSQVGNLPAGVNEKSKSAGLKPLEASPDSSEAAMLQSTDSKNTLIPRATMVPIPESPANSTAEAADNPPDPASDEDAFLSPILGQSDPLKTATSESSVPKAVLRHLQTGKAATSFEEASDSKASLGTTVASLGKQVSHTYELNKSAAQDEQFLPGTPHASRAGNEKESFSTSELPKVSGALVAHLTSQGIAAPHAASIQTFETQNPQSGLLDRLASGISHEVSVMRHVKPDKLEVVLRPDENTQISLQLQVTNGRIEGHARCERGDFSLLNSHWNELQRTFDQQGIRLLPLKDPSDSIGYSGGSFGDPSQFQQENKARRLEELVIAATTRTPSVKSAPNNKTQIPGDALLQTWA